MPILRADFEVCETFEYQHERPLECPIAAFGGAADQDVPREDLEAWSEQTSAPFSLRMFPGDHFYFVNQPAALLDEVARHMERVSAQSRSDRTAVGNVEASSRQGEPFVNTGVRSPNVLRASAMEDQDVSRRG
jgi:hypothetical protein